MSSLEHAGWRWARKHWAWLALGLTLLLVACVRVRLRDMPLERDEGEYAYMGQLMLQGVPPYKEACNMKLPGTYAAYALSMAVFGQTPAGIHLGLLLVNAGSIVLMFLLGRRLLDEVAGVVAAVCYALLSLSPSVVGTSAHATQFIVLPALGGILLMVDAQSKVQSLKPKVGTAGARLWTLDVRLETFLSGLLLGLAFLMKQHGIFFGFFGLVYLVWVRLFGGARDERRETSGGRRPRGEGRRVGPVPAVAPRLSHFAAARAKQPSTAEQTPNTKHQAPDKLQAPGSSSQHPQAASAIGNPQSAIRNEEAPEKFQAPFTVAPPPSAVTIPHSAIGNPQLADFALFLGGLALPYILTCLWLWWAGVFPEFFFWTISYARRYATLVSAAQGEDLFRTMLAAAVGYNFLLWLLPWSGALVMWWEDRLEKHQTPSSKLQGNAKRQAPTPISPQPLTNPQSAIRNPQSPMDGSAIPCPRFFLVALLFCSIGSISVGLYFRLHYFVTLLPVLALLSGVAVSRSLWVVRFDHTIELFLAVPVLLLFGLGIGAALIGNGSVWFGLSPTLAAQEVHGTTAFAEARTLADFIRTNTPPDARIAVLGSEPELFFYAHRRSASKYIYVYPLMEPQAFAGQMQKEMSGEIERARPEYVVFADDWTSWLHQPESKPLLFDWWRRYRDAHLELVRSVHIDIVRPSEVQRGVNDQRPEEAKPEQSGRWLLYKRRGNQNG